jgi:hypothetical protein
MRLAPFAVARLAGLPAELMATRPGGEVAVLLDRYHELADAIAAEERSLRLLLTGLRLPAGRSLASWAAKVMTDEARCPPLLAGDLGARMRRFVEDNGRLTAKAAEIEAAGQQALEDLRDWLTDLREHPFSQGVRASSATLYDEVFNRPRLGSMKKRERRALLGAMRLAQRAFYRTTPFPGLASAKVFPLSPTEPAPKAAQHRPREAHDTATWAVLSIGYDPDSPLMYRETSTGIQQVQLDAPELVAAAIDQLGLGLRPRAIDADGGEAATLLQDLTEIGVAAIPRRIAMHHDSGQPLDDSAIDLSGARQHVLTALQRLGPILPSLAQFGDFGRVEALREWALTKIGAGHVSLARLYRMVEVDHPITSAPNPTPPLLPILLAASASEAETEEITPPIVGNGAKRLSSLSLMTMYDWPSDLVVLNGILPGELRQIARHMSDRCDWPSASAWLADVHGTARLILHPYRTSPYQHVPSFGAASLYLPREPFDPSEQTVGLDDIDVTCSGSGFRFVERGTGASFAPFYAGCVRQQNLQLGVQMICALSATPYAEPLERLLEVHSLGDQAMLAAGRHPPLRRPRMICNGVVLQRRRWAHPARTVLASAATNSLVWWDAWRREQGMPRRCSVRRLRAGEPSYGQTPGILLDFSRAESVADWPRALRLGGEDWIIFEECLPDPETPGTDGRAVEYAFDVRF